MKSGSDGESGLLRLSWIVFAHAALLSIESIAVELLTAGTGLTPLAIGGTSILIAGSALVAISAARDRSGTIAVFRAWRILLPASGLLAIAVFAWYDSVTNVGASKEGLLAGPLEVVVILVLARLFLKERLDRPKTFGAAVALAGFFATVMSSGTLELLFTWGDLEAVISAVSFGTGVVLITRLIGNHSALQLTGSSLFITGLILFSILWNTAPVISLDDVTYVLAFSLLPLLAAYTYVVGLGRIGASMTSVIASFSILLTVVFQLVLLELGVDAILPSNVPLAVIGGVLGVLGIYLIHRNKGN